ERRDALARIDPATEARARRVHRHDSRSTRCELDLRHGCKGAPGAVPERIVERIVEQRRAVVAQRDAAAWAVGMKSIAQQGDDDLHVCKLAHPAGMRVTLPGERDRRKHGMNRRRLELVAVRAAGRDVEKMVRINGLRRAGKTVDPPGHQRSRYDRWLEKRAFAEEVVRSGNFVGTET